MGKLGGLLGQPCFPWSRQAAASFPTCPVQRVPAPLQKGGSSLPLMCAPSSELRTSAFDLMGEGVRARGRNGERWHTEEIAPFSVVGDCRGAHQQVNNTPPHGSIIEIYCGNRRITRIHVPARSTPAAPGRWLLQKAAQRTWCSSLQWTAFDLYVSLGYRARLSTY